MAQGASKVTRNFTYICRFQTAPLPVHPGTQKVEALHVVEDNFKGTKLNHNIK